MHVEDQQDIPRSGRRRRAEEKLPQIAARQCVVEGLVPAVEADLPVRGRGDHHHQGNRSETTSALPAGEAKIARVSVATWCTRPEFAALGLGAGAGDFLGAISHLDRALLPRFARRGYPVTGERQAYSAEMMTCAGEWPMTTDSPSKSAAGLPSILALRSAACERRHAR